MDDELTTPTPEGARLTPKQWQALGRLAGAQLPLSARELECPKGLCDLLVARGLATFAPRSRWPLRYVVTDAGHQAVASRRRLRGPWAPSTGS